MTMTPLNQLVTGQQGTVHTVRTTEGQAKRLADFGFVRGARIEMVRRGNPCIVRIDGTAVGLGHSFQQSIQLILT